MCEEAARGLVTRCDFPADSTHHTQFVCWNLFLNIWDRFRAFRIPQDLYDVVSWFKFACLKVFT